METGDGGRDPLAAADWERARELFDQAPDSAQLGMPLA